MPPGILNVRAKPRNKITTIMVFLLFSSLILSFLIKYTYYTPDAYVFVQYAYLDSVTRSVDFQSIISNNFIFDLMIVIGDLIGFYTPRDWINYTVVVYLAVFWAKYIFLLRKAPVYPVLIVYLASFFIDANQLRFNLALALIMAAHVSINRKRLAILLPLSFLAHVIPVSIYILSTLKRRPIVTAVGIVCSLAVFVYFGYFDLIKDSRLFGYASQEQEGLPKVLLLVFPTIYGLVYLKNDDPSVKFIRDYSYVLLVLGLAVAPINYFLTARFFETSFIVFTVYNSLTRVRRPELDLLLLVSSVAVLSSRLMFGIVAGADFAQRYVEIWRF